MESAKKLRVLCLDLETGLGGSSRSLWQSLQYMNRKAVDLEVWRRTTSVYNTQYAEISVPVRCVATIPKGKPVGNFWPNLPVLFRAGWELLAARNLVRDHAREISRRFDLVHFNLDSAFPYAWLLRKRVSIPFVCHMRSTTYPNVFFRWQTCLMSRTMDAFVFITENEQHDFRCLGGRGNGKVIYNIVDVPPVPPPIHSALTEDDRFRVACLSNYAYARGLDRLVEVAVELANAGRRDVLFVMAGDMRLKGRLPGLLGELSKQGASLEQYAFHRGVADMFLFLGHVEKPEQVLSGCHVLAKPTRMDNPWGRDILEAMAQGLPAVSVGAYNRFIENGKTGVLLPSFQARTMAQALVDLADDRSHCLKLGVVARERVASLCNGQSRAAELLEYWKEVVSCCRRSA